MPEAEESAESVCVDSRHVYSNGHCGVAMSAGLVDESTELAGIV
ncbi:MULTISPECIES: hypothetical protein [unclassified Roseobacter]|nr:MULTISPECIES: hypothetical protein [unclassified Roseobacter]